jgi:hypothetical protein
MSSPSSVTPEPLSTPAARTGATAHFRLNPFVPLAYLAVLLGSAFAAYWAMFSQFAPYDDSGYFINSIRLFTDGQALYDRVWTDYGPFSYELWAAVFGLTGQTLTTDSGRLIVVGIWLVTSLLLGVSCQRLTGRLAIGVIVQIVSFNLLTALDKEPMHASGVVCVLLALIVAVVSFVLPGRPRAALLTLGALVAALTLTKVNVGGYAAIAVIYATVMTFPTLWRVTPLRWLAAAALVAIGPMLMAGNLSQRWTLEYATLAVAGGLSFVLVTDVAEDSADGDAESARRWMRWLLGGFGACAVLVIGIVLALGSSFSAFFQETVVTPLNQGHAFTVPINFNALYVVFGVGMIAVAWAIRRQRARSGREGQPELLGALGRILVALAIWLPIALARYRANFDLAITLAWVAAIPSTRDTDSLQSRFTRLFLPALAILQALVAYPVAGSQVKFGSLLFLVCGAVCFADGWSDLEAWGATTRTGYSARTLHRIMIGLAGTLAVALAFQSIVSPMRSFHKTYDAQPRLPIAGATRLHLPAAQVSALTHVTTLLRSRCKSVITLPGLLSFNLWSGRPAPSGLTAEPFWHLLSRAQERSALARAKVTPGLCAVRSNQLVAFWDSGTPLPQVPLVRFIEREFSPIARYRGYVVSVRRP